MTLLRSDNGSQVLRHQKKDIALGEKFDVCKCPIARAIARVLKLKRVCVTPSALYANITGGIDNMLAPLPIKAILFIFQFDQGLTDRKPFSAKIHIRESVLKRGG